jgi:hypothetical protein
MDKGLIAKKTLEYTFESSLVHSRDVNIDSALSLDMWGSVRLVKQVRLRLRTATKLSHCVTVGTGGKGRTARWTVKVTNILGGGRRVFSRIVVTSALLGSGFIVGMTTTASAAPPATHLNITIQPSTTGTSGSALAQQPVVRIEDSGNSVVTGDTSNVTATITAGGVSVSNPTVAAVAGVATFSGLALNALVGSYTLTFTDGSLTSATSNSISVTVGTATQLVITTQPSPGSITGVPLVRQPVVKAEDSGGNVVTSVNSGNVTATIGTGPGAVSAGSTAPFLSGVASFSGVTLTGSSGFLNTLNFNGATLPQVTSNSISMSTAPTHIVLMQQPSAAGFSGLALLQQPVVQVLDGSNNVVVADSSTVTATITPPLAGSVSNGTMAVVNGVATFSGLAVNALVGTYTLTFTDGAFIVGPSTSIGLSSGAPTKLLITRQPSSAVQSGAALSQQPIVQIQDSGGNIVTSNGSTVVATLTTGSGTITSPSAAAVAGIASFSGLTINAAAGLYTLTFSDGSLTTAQSTSISVGAGLASHLAIVTQPSSSAASGVALAQQPVVKVNDSGGNVVTGTTSVVTATLTTGTGTVSNGTAVVSSSTGVATFSGLALNAAVGSYTLTFSDGTLTTAVSTAIAVTSGPAAKLVIAAQPSATALSGSPLAQQPVIYVEDASGNIVTSDTSTVTARITTGGVSLTSPTKAAVAGVASFSGLALNALVGTYTLTFSDGSLTTSVSNNVAVLTGAASQLVITTEPNLSATSGVALAQQPVVKVEDSGGNVATSVTTGSASASVYTGSGGAVSAGSTANFIAGVATFSGLTLTGVSGNIYTLIFAGASFSAIDATRIVIGTPQAPLNITSTRATWGRSLTLTTAGGSGTGLLTLAVTGGTASGCTISGKTLTYSSLGTCVVTASKAGNTTYIAASSPATTISITKLPIPGVVRIMFTANSSVLSGAAKNQIVVLIRKLTVKSSVTITGYAKGNLGLAQRRAVAVSQFLVARLHVKLSRSFVTKVALSAAQVATKGQ